jgi:quinol monooxygenase YgiN
MALGVAQIPWYATLFRGDQFAAAVAEIAPISLRYGALDYIVYRNRDDQYKFMQCSTWASKAEWEAYWYGPEMTTFKTVHSGWYQVPLLYTFADIVASGSRDGNPHHDVVTSGTPTTGDAQAS